MAWKKGKQRRRGRSKKIKGHAASLVQKLVFCKTCQPKCRGHGPYRYLVWREGDKVKWKYLGR